MLSHTLTWLITFAGIGAMMANALDANGVAKVYIIGRRLAKLEEVAASAPNKTVIPLQGDITSKESLASCASRILSETPFVNVVIANSGTMGPTVDNVPKDSLEDLHAFLWKPSMEEYNDTFMVNSTAVFYTMLAFLPLLDAGNKHAKSPTVSIGVKSQFIATSSIGAFNRVPGAGFAYAASKAGVIHMMKQIATWMVPYHIRANTFNPGIFPSDMSTASSNT